MKSIFARIPKMFVKLKDASNADSVSVGDSQAQNDEKRIEEITSELNDCREDERTSQNQMVQVIVTAGTILGVLFGMSALSNSGDNVNNDSAHYLFYLSVFIFCTAITYVVTLGMGNVLRFHYIRSLEDRLFLLIPDKTGKTEIIHWMSFSSPILTRNPKHLNNPYSRLHYFLYAVATICVCLFSMVIIWVLYGEIKNRNIIDYLFLCMIIFIVILAIASFFFASIKAKSMYKLSLEKSINNRQKRLDEKLVLESPQQKERTYSEKKQLDYVDRWKVIKYFLYPKLKDLQKPGLIILGFYMGNFLYKGVGGLRLSKQQVLFMLIVFVVIDFLAYQARYQWNDIRGVKEDVEAGKEDRLPVGILGLKRAVGVSLLIMTIRITVSLGIAVALRDRMGNFLWICVISVICISIIYEFFRSKESVCGILFSVSFGYPIRLLAGMWAAWPTMWSDNIISNGIIIPYSNWIILLILIAFSCFGAFSATLPWVHEAVEQMRLKDFINKRHYKYLFNQLKERYDSLKGKSLNKVFPLREEGKMFDVWNFQFFLSILILSIIVCIISYLLKMDISNIIIAVELVGLIFIIRLCFAQQKRIIFFTLVSVVMLIAKIIAAIYYIEWYTFYVFVCINQCFFVLLYFFLRYLFQPDFNFVKACKKVIKELIKMVIGRVTVNYIKEQVKNKEENDIKYK